MRWEAANGDRRTVGRHPGRPDRAQRRPRELQELPRNEAQDATEPLTTAVRARSSVSTTTSTATCQHPWPELARYDVNGKLKVRKAAA